MAKENGLAKVIKNWHNNTRDCQGHVSTDGRVLFSYMAPIALQFMDTFYVLESGVYSITTTKHCNAAASASPAGCVKRVTKAELKKLIAEATQVLTGV